jgi:hypothetical protein
MPPPSALIAKKQTDRPFRASSEADVGQLDKSGAIAAGVIDAKTQINVNTPSRDRHIAVFGQILILKDTLSSQHRNRVIF